MWEPCPHSRDGGWPAGCGDGLADHVTEPTSAPTESVGAGSEPGADDAAPATSDGTAASGAGASPAESDGGTGPETDGPSDPGGDAPKSAATQADVSGDTARGGTSERSPTAPAEEGIAAQGWGEDPHSGPGTQRSGKPEGAGSASPGATGG